jgi:HAUS augmin-like complex subunit 1
MARIPPDAAIFSPTVARLAASTAKDWNYVDSWLASKYNGRTVPPFERNPETLKALLALATLNETADEKRHLVNQVDAIALQDINTAQDAKHEAVDEQSDHPPVNLASFKDEFYSALEDSLTTEGKTALDAMASAAGHLGMTYPEPAALARAVLDLQERIFGLERSAARVGILRRLADSESTSLDELLEDVRGDEYRPPADLARHNLDLQRKIKAMVKRLPEVQARVASLARTVGVPDPTIQQVSEEEARYLESLDLRRRLHQQVSEFEGLPADVDLARQQLHQLREELRTITGRRDAVFEGLVERETPRKAR